ncbi:uncharacterized protein LOC144304624 isoform X2 [Canis aureus]
MRHVPEVHGMEEGPDEAAGQQRSPRGSYGTDRLFQVPGPGRWSSVYAAASCREPRGSGAGPAAASWEPRRPLTAEMIHTSILLPRCLNSSFKPNQEILLTPIFVLIYDN